MKVADPCATPRGGGCVWANDACSRPARRVEPSRSRALIMNRSPALSRRRGGLSTNLKRVSRSSDTSSRVPVGGPGCCAPLLTTRAAALTIAAQAAATMSKRRFIAPSCLGWLPTVRLAERQSNVRAPSAATVRLGGGELPADAFHAREAARAECCFARRAAAQAASRETLLVVPSRASNARTPTL